ncbi:UPF0223 family protein [Streptococcus sp. CSL10205-OR2]|uniref:UPF0223 family protein n=1 Tax=Streptococcus sp. CSL10205-OR2 TaxID=2980558 RepID=UPI0021DA3205|nr:UPF0223 family protein [Streptococcus sp. CSL10205-OR2]MCU9533303.1 UPF0223 family protein [Streptococcus sp. CSL10205-OR2]
MTSNYSYPLDLSWSTEEMISVLHFLNQVEKAYESKVEVSHLLKAYDNFKKIVTSKSQEKQIDKSFEKTSGYSIYQVMKLAREKKKGVISFGKKI